MVELAGEDLAERCWYSRRWTSWLVTIETQPEYGFCSSMFDSRGSDQEVQAEWLSLLGHRGAADMENFKFYGLLWSKTLQTKLSIIIPHEQKEPHSIKPVTPIILRKDLQKNVPVIWVAVPQQYVIYTDDPKHLNRGNDLEIRGSELYAALKDQADEFLATNVSKSLRLKTISMIKLLCPRNSTICLEYRGDYKNLYNENIMCKGNDRLQFHAQVAEAELIFQKHGGGVTNIHIHDSNVRTYSIPKKYSTEKSPHIDAWGSKKNIQQIWQKIVNMEKRNNPCLAMMSPRQLRRKNSHPKTDLKICPTQWPESNSCGFAGNVTGAIHALNVKIHGEGIEECIKKTFNRNGFGRGKRKCNHRFKPY